MISITNKVYETVPNIIQQYPDLCSFINSTTTVSGLFACYQSWVLGGLPPKQFKVVENGNQLIKVLDQLLHMFDIDHTYTYKKIDGHAFKTYTLVRGREFVVVNDKTKGNDALRVAEKYIQLLQSAKSRKLPFNLTLSDVRALLNRKTCFYTKEAFGAGNKKRTVDRLDCNLGYVRGNVVACTEEANSLKEHFFEHTGHDPDTINKLFYSYFTLVAKGKITPKKGMK